MRLEPGIYLVHKPVGVTSFSVVQGFLKEAAAQGGRPLKLCHGGTLDPFAEGLLLILVGQATHLMDRLHQAPKRYLAELQWGRETDTGDAGGKTVFGQDPSGLTPDALNAALVPFLGWTEQVPPATSAKKLGGEPAYRKAHRGETVVLPPSKVFLQEAHWHSHDLPRASWLSLTCRGGFYVRSLARELGRALGCGAHLSRLSRPAIGPWEDPPQGERVWIHGQGLLPWYPSRTLSDAELGALRQGAFVSAEPLQRAPWPFPRGFPPAEPAVRLFHHKKWVALGSVQEGALRPDLFLRGGL